MTASGSGLRISRAFLRRVLPDITEEGDKKKQTVWASGCAGQVSKKIGNSISIRSEAGNGTTVILSISDGPAVVE